MLGAKGPSAAAKRRVTVRDPASQSASGAPQNHSEDEHADKHKQAAQEEADFSHQ